MKNVTWTTAFKKDYKRMIKRGKSAGQMKEVIKLLAEGKVLDDKHKNHPLLGNFVGKYECHIEPDWLLIYQPKAEEIVMIRTGTHSDLFK